MPILTDKIEIKINGEKIGNYKFSNIQLVQELQKPNKLTFCLHKDDVLQSENLIRYSITEKLLGKSVELTIKTVRENNSKKIENDTLTFSGTIFNVNILKKNLLAGAVIEVTAFSPDYFLCDNPHCCSYEDKTLKEIVEKTLKPFEIEVTNNPVQQEKIHYTVQYNETNYNFLRRLSSRYGEWLYFDGEKLTFGKMNKKDTATLALGNDVKDYHYRLNMEHLNFLHAHHNYLDYGNSKTEPYANTGDSLHNLTDIAYKNSKNLYEKETFQHLKCSAPEDSFDETEFSAKVQALGLKSQMLICCGSSIRADLRIGSVIKIEEEYQKENGDKTKCYHDELVICKLIHTSDGISNYENMFVAIPANCETPPYSYKEHYPKAEPQRAVVKDNKDPEKLGRVRVQFLWQKEQDKEMITPWIRIAQPHGGDKKGFYFIPEIDEEVMVSFENGNAEKPYVTGTLYHGNQRPNWYNETNDIKAIRTRNGHTIEFHDVEENGFIRIYDNKKDNYILTFSTDDKLIKLESTGNIELYAKNDIIMKADNIIDMKAGKDITGDAGENITNTAGKNMTIVTGENMTISASNDMDTNIGNNNNLYIGSNQTVEIKANKSETIAEKYQLTADTIREEGLKKLLLYGEEIEQRGGKTLKFDGGKTLDLYAGNIRMN